MFIPGFNRLWLAVVVATPYQQTQILGPGMGLLEELFSLNGRVAVVTGASRGLGAAIAAGLAEAGATVFGVGRSALDIPPKGWTYRPCDVTDHSSFEELTAEICRRQDRIDILVNAAAITRPTFSGLQSQEDFEQTISVNLATVYACCVAVAVGMEKAGRGSIINITSIGSVLGFPNNPGYVASKGGLRMLTRSLAIDLANKGIRVNNLAPGYIHTEMTDASYVDPERHEARRRHTVLGRWGKPRDVVGAAIFLASDASSYVTGQDLFVDGGWTAKGLI